MSILSSVVDVYRLFLRSGNELTVTTLVNELGMPKSSASRLLKQMAELGLLEKKSNAPIYRPGLLVMEIAHRARGMNHLIDMALEALDSLTKDSGFTSYVSALDEDKVRVVHARIGNSMLQVITQPGTRLPIAGTSTGRALLARLPVHERAELIKLESEEQQASLDERMNIILARGWEFSVNESVAGVASVSSTVYDPSQSTLYALCLSLPASQMTEEVIEQLSQDLCRKASYLGCMVGDPYWLERSAK
ncbi:MULTISPECIES: IclR family transcriptional regulator [Providencia]|uniref:Transcriptional regulator, IclR family, C-terminal domain protein n=2 Tax=Providencia rustigianii TaxID=158850 RepID=D1NX99_9GAMM|nr:MULTISPECIES: IclR family transcriptional regulator [Providencia]EFB74038.1 transcriptional regulator, IclR family, C-terminal domain protein [Providencia rustigianii DSM 4541]MTC57029.1 helix-turn-helix domain-containing protein [Providencia rustigianii]SPY77026.1 Transcriptional regulator kdgR [Providencia rustigianii]SUC26276.1 Transcriptional regulator kdgR [Providencia rustigianii]SUC34970.1 Transcriptional regulator kdgR [Providencia rustigianii]